MPVVRARRIIAAAIVAAVCLHLEVPQTSRAAELQTGGSAGVAAKGGSQPTLCAASATGRMGLSRGVHRNLSRQPGCVADHAADAVLERGSQVLSGAISRVNHAASPASFGRAPPASFLR